MEFVFPYLNNNVRKHLSTTCKFLNDTNEEVPIQEYTHNGPYDPKLKRVRRLTISNTAIEILELPLCEYLHIENCTIKSIRAPRLKYIKTNQFYSVHVQTYELYEQCSQYSVTDTKPIYAKEIITNHCMIQHLGLQHLNNVPNLIIHSTCAYCGPYAKQRLTSTTIIIKDALIDNQVFYDAANIYFQNSSFRSCPELSKQLQCLSWNTCNAIVSDFPRLPNTLLYLDVENNFTLTELPECPTTLTSLFMMHTGIVNQVYIASHFPQLKELSMNVEDTDLANLHQLSNVKSLSLCYKNFTFESIVQSVANLVNLNKLTLYLRSYFYRQPLIDKLRLTLPNTVCNIYPCRY